MIPEEQATITKGLDAITEQLKRVNAALELLLQSLAEREAKSPRYESIVHGVNCPKTPHNVPGYLHDVDDDSPYDIDGVTYCGRCHFYMESK